MQLSNRVSQMQSSPIRRLVPYAQKAKAAGKKVYHLNIGQPDIKTPPSFFEAVRKFEAPVLAYATSDGLPELKKAISNYYAGYNMDYQPEDILITSGGSEALLFAIMAACDDGDEVLVPEPFYTNYNGFAAEIGVTVRPIVTKAENGFMLPEKKQILEAITPKIKAIILSNPGNPTGAVYPREQVEMIAEIAKEKNLFIIADEVYREFVYDGMEYTSFGHMNDVLDRVIIIDSVSKRYSACGARVGSLACKNKNLIAAVMKLCQGRLCVATLDQVGAAALYDTPVSYFKEVNEEYKKRRDIVYKALNEIPGIVCKEPKGAFYVVAKMPVDDAEKFIIWMLENFDHNGETLMMAPAEGFYSTPGIGKDEARIAYVLETTELEKAMEVLKLGLEEYPGRTL